jgi:hypothetical protein
VVDDVGGVDGRSCVNWRDHGISPNLFVVFREESEARKVCF